MESLLSLPQRGIPPRQPAANGSCSGCYELLRASESVELTRPRLQGLGILAIGARADLEQLEGLLDADLGAAVHRPELRMDEVVTTLRKSPSRLVLIVSHGSPDLGLADALLAADPELVITLVTSAPEPAAVLKALNRGVFSYIDLAGDPAEQREIWSRSVGVARLQLDRHALRQQLIRERHRERLMLEHLDIGIVALDEGFRVLSANPAAIAILDGLSRRGEDFRETCATRVEVPGGGTPFVQQLEAAFGAKGPTSITDATVEPPDGGGRRIVCIDLIPIPDLRLSEPGLLVSCRDVTHERSLAETVVQQERLAAIGTMAASVAHELKNPLAGIAGALEVLLDAIPPQEDLLRIRDEVRLQVGRLSDLAADLLGYAKPIRVAHVATSVATLLSSLRDTVERHPAFEGVEIESDVCDVPVWIDGVQFPTVMFNLLLNAAQAGGKGSKVRVRARTANSSVFISVADEGPGFSDEALERAFEPFFTTKSRGTGLGLPLCSKIVTAHGGTLSLENRSEGGGLAVIEIPAPEV